MAYEIQNKNGLVLDRFTSDGDTGGGMTHIIGFGETGFHYTDADEARDDVFKLERLGYDVSLVEVQ